MWSFSFHREVLYHPVMKTLLLSLSVLPMGIFLSSEVKVIFIAVCSQWCFFPVLRKSVIIDDRKVYLVFKEMGHLQLSNHVAQNRLTGKQMTHWDMLNKENSNLVAFFNMSQCVICPPVWQFCTTWLLSCKRPIECCLGGKVKEENLVSSNVIRVKFPI